MRILQLVRWMEWGGSPVIVGSVWGHRRSGGRLRGPANTTIENCDCLVWHRCALPLAPSFLKTSGVSFSSARLFRDPGPGDPGLVRRVPRAKAPSASTTRTCLRISSIKPRALAARDSPDWSSRARVSDRRPSAAPCWRMNMLKPKA